MTTPKHPTTLLFSFLALLASAPAFAASGEEIRDGLKTQGYRCVPTPRKDGYFCTGGSPKNYITIPSGVGQIEKTVFYAHGLVGVCGNGASGEKYLQNESPTLARVKAVAVMPWRQSAGNTGFPLSGFIQRMDRLLGGARPLLLAGHSAAGPFFATTLNGGTGAAIAPRVEKVLLLDAIYGDQTARWRSILNRNGNMKLKIVSNTTMGRSRTLYNQLQRFKFGTRVSLDQASGGGHCGMPVLDFKRLASF